MSYNIALVKGDGIGPEIIASAVKLLKLVGEKSGFDFNFYDAPAGGCAIDARNRHTFAAGMNRFMQEK